MDADIAQAAVAKMIDANLGPGERLAVLIAAMHADERGVVCRSQRDVAAASGVTTVTVGHALRKLRDHGLARQISEHVPGKGQPARWRFLFGRHSARGRS